MSIPWEVINRRLVEAGAIVAGIGRRAQARGCNRCRGRIITGWDGDVCALIAEVDPTPLSTLGEALAQLQGRRTYTLASEGGRLVLNDRTPGRIGHRPAGTGHFDVMPEHRCGAAPLPELPSVLTDRSAALPLDAPAPF